jgi:DNA anti-recombination protein RmuC
MNDPTHPIGRVRAMSGELNPETITLREFGKAVADALEYLATVIQSSHNDLRSDIKSLVESQTRLTGQMNALIQRMDRADRPRLTHQELRIVQWKANEADLNRLRGLNDVQREEFRPRIDELEREQDRLASEITQFERNLSRSLAQSWADAEESRMDKLGETLQKRIDERESAQKEEGQNG